MDDMNDSYPQWEHHIEYIAADTHTPQARDALASYYPGQRPPMYAIQAILPRLNQLGALGWELVHLEPVEVGVNGISVSVAKLPTGPMSISASLND